MTPRPIKILLVDDTPENLVALSALLRRDGIEILTARSGGEALELLLVHEVSLALLDVQMPEMDGFELAELMRGAERTKHIPIIFVTAGARDPSRVFKGYDSGAVDFLFKPIDGQVLRSKVDVFIELARQRQELAHALHLNEVFVGIVGHDLRTPLAAVIAGVDLLRMQLTDERQVKTLDRMERSGRRMAEMIEALLDLTRVRLGVGGGAIAFARNRQPLDLREVVQRAVDELRAAHPNRAIALELGAEARTLGDGERLVQLFSNLVGNALTHGTAGTPVAAAISGAEREVVVEIRNQGVIPPERLTTIFEPFADRGRDRGGRGLGLGMFISHQIVTAHDGTITVTSSEPGGTVLTVRLPRHLADG